MNRRQFRDFAVLLGSVLMFVGCATTSPAKHVMKAAPKEVNIKVFKNAVVASPFSDGIYWYLRSDLVWLSASDQLITVPAGFVTDFASIPRPLWAILPKWEKYGPAAVVHDYLYWDQAIPRKAADEIMLEAMKDSKVPAVKRAVIYGVLRCFGGFAWNADAREKKEGRIRIIQPANWPTNPSESWEECQERIGATPQGP